MKYTFSAFLIFMLINTTACQDQALKNDYKKDAIERINELISDNYVFPEIAKSTSDHLSQKFKEGSFDSATNRAAFARMLTREVQSVNHDKHMRIRPRNAGTQRTFEDAVNDGGFKEVKMLENNIGYIDMRLFLPVSVASSIADEHMKTLARANAIIIDLRNNGGGNPGMVQYLCSYFFDKTIHLNSLYYRKNNTTREFWTVDVAGKKMPAIPLFILTSNKTFSAAEEFSYNMQTQKRATLVGETTGGGANPGGVFPIDDEIEIFIPTGKAINPITKTNWEGVGVIPDIKIEADKALEKAIGLAKETVVKK